MIRLLRTFTSSSSSSLPPPPPPPPPPSSSSKAKFSKSCIFCKSCISQNKNMVCLINSKECSTLRPFYPISPFDLMNDGKIEYEINSKTLKERFHQLQKELHPDRNPSASEWSSHVNQCYQLLNNPLQRAIKMYELLTNVPLTEENFSLLVKQDDLELYMELRERIDVTNNKKDLFKIYNEVCKLIDATTTTLVDCLKSEKYQEAKTEIARLKFLYSIEDSLVEKKK